MAYLDESGTHANSVATVVAGYIGFHEKWHSFESQWAEILSQFGLSRVHATEMALFKKAFRDWNDARRTAFLTELTGIIKSGTLCAVSACLVNSDYEAAFAKLTTRIQRDSKYALCFRACMIRAASFTRANWPGERISFVLEDGCSNKGDATRIYDLTRESTFAETRWPIENLMITPKGSLGALQTADLLAYSVYRYVRSYVEAGYQHIPAHKNTFLLLDGMSHIDVFISRAEMEKQATAVNELVAIRQATSWRTQQY